MVELAQANQIVPVLCTLLPIPHTQWLLNPGGLFQLTE